MASTTPSLHTAPRGQCRIIARDRDTGVETFERDCWDAHDAHGYIHETADDRPWMIMTVYDERGEEVE